MYSDDEEAEIALLVNRLYAVKVRTTLTCVPVAWCSAGGVVHNGHHTSTAWASLPGRCFQTTAAERPGLQRGEWSCPLVHSLGDLALLCVGEPLPLAITPRVLHYT